MGIVLCPAGGASQRTGARFVLGAPWALRVATRHFGPPGRRGRRQRALGLRPCRRVSVYVTLSRARALGSIGLRFTPSAIFRRADAAGVTDRRRPDAPDGAATWADLRDALKVDGDSRIAPWRAPAWVAAGSAVFLAAFGRAIAKSATLMVGGNIRARRAQCDGDRPREHKGEIALALALGSVSRLTSRRAAASPRALEPRSCLGVADRILAMVM